jgi:hypothetical protein
MNYKHFQFYIFNFTFLIFIACAGNQKPPASEVNKDSISIAPIPLVREHVQKAPILTYSERTDNPLNDWYFSVKLYETKNTFHYLIKMQFEEIRGTDTLRLPNFGTMPEPVIQKGKAQYSCIIGFLDKDKNFREYKKVYVKNNVLRITALKHYAVTERTREVK